MRLNVLLIGQESAGTQVLRAIARSEHRLVAVVAGEAAGSGGGAGVREVAAKLGCPVWPAERVRDPSFPYAIRAHAVDLILNAHSLHILAREVLDAPRMGS